MPLYHATLVGPSSSHRVELCNGSVAMSSGLAGKESEPASTGTCLHELGDWCLKMDVPAGFFAGETMAMWTAADGEPGVGFYDEAPIDARIDFTLALTDDWIESVQTYLDIVAAYRANAVEFMPEIRVDISHAIGIEDQFGTSDCILVLRVLDVITGEESHELCVIDYKSGRVFVSPDRNSQGMFYASGARKMLAHKYNFTSIRIVIVQPRISHKPQEWACTPEELDAFEEKWRGIGQNVLRLLAEPNRDVVIAALTPSEEACNYCPAAQHGACPALMNSVVDTVFPMSASDAGFEVLDAHRVIESLDMAKVYPKRDLIELFLKAIDRHALELMTNGTGIPGFKLGTGKQGNRKWKAPAEAPKLLAQAGLTDEQIYDRKPISPTKAESLLAKKHPEQWEALQEQIGRADGRLIVLPESDPRPAANLASADAFQPE